MMITVPFSLYLRSCLPGIFLWGMITATRADVSLFPLFSDHAVLQKSGKVLGKYLGLSDSGAPFLFLGIGEHL